MLADRLVLAHLAADVRGLLAEGQPVPAFPEADQPTGLPSLRVDAEAGFACTGFSIRGLPAIGIQSSRNDPPLAFLVLDAEQLGRAAGARPRAARHQRLSQRYGHEIFFTSRSAPCILAVDHSTARDACPCTRRQCQRAIPSP